MSRAPHSIRCNDKESEAKCSSSRMPNRQMAPALSKVPSSQPSNGWGARWRSVVAAVQRTKSIVGEKRVRHLVYVQCSILLTYIHKGYTSAPKDGSAHLLAVGCIFCVGWKNICEGQKPHQLASTPLVLPVYYANYVVELYCAVKMTKNRISYGRKL